MAFIGHLLSDASVRSVRKSTLETELDEEHLGELFFWGKSTFAD